MIGVRSWPSISTPHSSLVGKFIGPDHAVAAARPQPRLGRVE